MTVLYGVGKARDEARHIVKKVTKETVKLFSKKNCIDVGSGDLGNNKTYLDRKFQKPINITRIFHQIKQEGDILYYREIIRVFIDKSTNLFQY
jgi:hypothetical protein